MTAQEVEAVLAGSPEFAKQFARLAGEDAGVASKACRRVLSLGQTFPIDQQEFFLNLAVLTLMDSHARTHVSNRDPDAITGRKVRTANPGGRSPKVEPSQLRAEVEALLRQHPKQTLGWARKQVAKKHSVCAKTVERHTKGVKRPPK